MIKNLAFPLSPLSLRLDRNGQPLNSINTGRPLPPGYPAQRIEVRWSNDLPWVTCDSVQTVPSFMSDVHKASLIEVRLCEGMFGINSGNYNFQHGIPEESLIGLHSLTGSITSGEVIAGKLRHCKVNVSKERVQQLLNSPEIASGQLFARIPVEVSWVAKYRTMGAGKTFLLRYTGWSQPAVTLKPDL